MRDLSRRGFPARLAPQGADRRPSVRLIGWLAPALVLVMVWLVLVAPFPRYDFLVFYRAGSDVLGGHNPYPVLGTPAVYGGGAFVYPWAVAFVFAPFALLSSHVSDLLYFLISGASVLVGCRVAGLRDPVSVTLVLAAATTIRGFQVGSLNGLLFLGCILAWRYRHRPTLVALALTLVVGSKVFLLPLVGWLVPTRRWAALAGTAGGLLAVFTTSFVVGPLPAGRYLALLQELSAHEGVQGFSLYGLVAHVAGGHAASLVCLTFAAGVVGVGWVSYRRGGQQPELALFASCLVAALALTPVLWSHYVLVGLVPLVLARPRRSTLLLASTLSWLVAPPVGTPKLLALPSQASVLLLYAGLVAMVVWLAIRPAGAFVAASGTHQVDQVPTAVLPAPDPHLQGAQGKVGA